MQVEPILPSVIDSSMMKTFKACPQKFYNEYVLGLRSKSGSIHLVAGGAFASAMEQVNRAVYDDGLTLPQALEKGYVAFAESWGDFPQESGKSPKTFIRVWGAVEEYFKHHPPLTDPYLPTKNSDGSSAVEFTIAQPLPVIHPVTNEPFIYGGRFDVLSTLGSELAVRDEKTTGIMTGDWVSQWGLRSQFIGYTWGASNALGRKVRHVVIRGICIQKTQYKFATAIETFPDHVVEKWYTDLITRVAQIKSCWLANYWPHDFDDACTNYGRCMFYDLCRSKEPSRWYPLYQVSRWNPLAKIPVEEKVEQDG